MKSRQWMAAVIAVSALATVGSAVADRSSDGPVAAPTQTRAGGASMNAYIYDWARPEWIGSNMDTGARGVAGSRYSGRTRAEVRAEAIEHTQNFKPGSDDMYGR